MHCTMIMMKELVGFIPCLVGLVVHTVPTKVQMVEHLLLANHHQGFDHHYSGF